MQHTPHRRSFLPIEARPSINPASSPVRYAPPPLNMNNENDKEGVGVKIDLQLCFFLGGGLTNACYGSMYLQKCAACGEYITSKEVHGAHTLIFHIPSLWCHGRRTTNHLVYVY